MFDIFSIDFVEKMIAMLRKSTKLIIKTIDKEGQHNIKRYIREGGINEYREKILRKIIGQCAIYILTKIELKPDNIVPPNEQIDISKKLDEKYLEITNHSNFIINNYNR